MNEFIEPNAGESIESGPLPKGHSARKYADTLPTWHPVRRLFTEDAQWLGRVDAVYAFLRLFCIVYEDYIWPVKAPYADVQEEFLRHFPGDVVFHGQRFDLHRLHAQARRDVARLSYVSPTHRSAALYAFDNTVAMLVRAVR